jgi:hypothetical protein
VVLAGQGIEDAVHDPRLLVLEEGMGDVDIFRDGDAGRHVGRNMSS